MEILSYIASRVTDDENSKNLHFFPYGAGIFIFIAADSEKINKFQKLREMVLNNAFLDAGQKAFYMTTFRKIQNVFWCLKKVIRHWRINRAKKYSVDTDLCLNSFRNFPKEQKTIIYQCGRIYEFRLTDIIRIWTMALSHSVNFTPIPRIPKNPYLNIEFNNAHLFHFYMCIRDNAKFAIPTLIEKFIKNNMDIAKFRFNNYENLIEPMIANYVENTSEYVLFFDIIGMLSSYKKQLRKRNLSQSISDKNRKKVIKIFKPILKMHLTSVYSCNPLKITTFEIETILKLKDVFLEHPMIGRKIVTIRQQNAPIFVYEGNISDDASTEEGADEEGADEEGADEEGADEEIDDMNNIDEQEVELHEHISQDEYNSLSDDSDDSL